MSPEVAPEKVRALDGVPKASLVGWRVITEPDTSDAAGERTDVRLFRVL